MGHLPWSPGNGPLATGERGGAVTLLPGPNPRGVGRGVQRGGGGPIFCRGLGAFLNSLFHSEHLERTQVRGLTSRLTIYRKRGGGGGNGWAMALKMWQSGEGGGSPPPPARPYPAPRPSYRRAWPMTPHPPNATP